MSGHDTILMRRMGVRTELVKKGWLSPREPRTVLDGECGEDEVLCAVDIEGKSPRVVKVGKDRAFAEGQAPRDRELLFAVRRTPFVFDMAVSAGRERDGFEWFFEVGGMLEILRPESFAAKFRGTVTAERPLGVEAFEAAQGTIPTTVLHDKVTMDVLGVPSLEDKDENKQYADIRKRLEAWREANEAFVASAINLALDTFFVTKGTARLDGSSFRARSPDREKAEERRRIAEEEARKAAVAQQAAAEAKEQERKDKERKQADELNELEFQNQLAAKRRENDLAEAEQQLRLAEKQRQREALLGPRPEIWMEAPLYEQGSNVRTRDCVLETSTTYSGQATASKRPRNTIKVGDHLDFRLRTNIDGWLHLYNYGTSGKINPLFTNRHIFANETYAIEDGGNLHNGHLLVTDMTLTTRESGRLERFIAIITRERICLDENSVKAVFDRRNPGTGFRTRGKIGMVEEVGAAPEEVPLEEAMASLMELPPEDWVQGTLELEVI